MILWEPSGATKATGGLKDSNLQLYGCFPIGKPVNRIPIPISDRLKRRGIAAFSTPC